MDDHTYIHTYTHTHIHAYIHIHTKADIDSALNSFLIPYLFHIFFCICCSCICCNIFCNVIYIFCLHLVLTKSIDWFIFCHVIAFIFTSIKAHVIFQTPDTNFPTKGLRSKRRICPCISTALNKRIPCKSERFTF
jgi:hypothetical protein